MPVAFLTPICFKYLSTSFSLTGVNLNCDSLKGMFSLIALLLGCWSNTALCVSESVPIYLATFTKKSLNISHTCFDQK